MNKHIVYLPADLAHDHPIELLGPITEEDHRVLRADVEFTDGTVALLTYPSSTKAFYGVEPPRMQIIPDGIYLAKGEAGDFRFVDASQAESLIAQVA